MLGDDETSALQTKIAMLKEIISKQEEKLSKHDEEISKQEERIAKQEEELAKEDEEISKLEKEVKFLKSLNVQDEQRIQLLESQLDDRQANTRDDDKLSRFGHHISIIRERLARTVKNCSLRKLVIDLKYEKAFLLRDPKIRRRRGQRQVNRQSFIQKVMKDQIHSWGMTVEDWNVMQKMSCARNLRVLPQNTFHASDFKDDRAFLKEQHLFSDSETKVLSLILSLNEINSKNRKRS